MTILAPDKEQVLEAAIGGLSRVAEAIVAVPTEARTKSLHAAENSYRRTARTWGYDEAEIDEWVSVIMFRLRAEVSAQESAHQQYKPKHNSPSLVPTSTAQE